MTTEPLLLVILGPTASGKSSLALEIAGGFDGEIVNCDSMQAIRRLDIGTAKPTPEERCRVPHHLFDVVDPGEPFSAGAYMVRAREVCRQIAERNRLPIVVGGTGLYLKALLEGIFAGPGRSERYRSRVRRILQVKGPENLYRALERRDPTAAARIRPADSVRVIRALEVNFVAGAPISSLQSDRTPLQGFRIVKVGLNPPRPDLYARIDARVASMFRRGLVKEVRALLESGLSADAKGFEALGYRNAIQVLEGRLDEETAIRLTQRDTRRYAKRQLTWFRREPEVVWMACTGEDSQVREQVAALLRKERQ